MRVLKAIVLGVAGDLSGALGTAPISHGLSLDTYESGDVCVIETLDSLYPSDASFDLCRGNIEYMARGMCTTKRTLESGTRRQRSVAPGRARGRSGALTA